MLPNFPEFSHLVLSQKAEIEKITSIFPPYSDFNFVSMWCYDLSKKTEVSLLNGNLVVKMEDYVTTEIFYMFIGKNKIEETLEKLFEYLKNNKLPQELYLIPEEIIKDNLENLRTKYVVEEDRDNFDYIISVEALSNMSGRALHQKRKLLNKFNSLYNPTVTVFPINDTYVKNTVLDFFEVWKKIKGEYDSKNEEIAINNLFHGLEELQNIFLLVATLDNRTIGFSMIEILENGYAVGGFQKGDTQLKGIYEFINNSVGKFLKEKKVDHYNIEQDLGIVNLRRAKLDYNPTFLKKYTVKKL